MVSEVGDALQLLGRLHLVAGCALWPNFFNLAGNGWPSGAHQLIRISLGRELSDTDILPTLSRRLLVRIRNLVKLLVPVAGDLSLALLIAEKSSRLASDGGATWPHATLVFAFGLWLLYGALVALIYALGLNLGLWLIILYLRPLLHLILVEHLYKIYIFLLVVKLCELVRLARGRVLHGVKLRMLLAV